MLVAFTYLITKDAVETLERKFGYCLDEILKREIKNLENEFLSKFWSCIPRDLEKVEIEGDTMLKQLEKIVEKSCYPIISLDRVYFRKANEYLETTRITDPKTGKVVKIAERPGTILLSEQIYVLKKKYEKIALADVGAFSGGTLLEIIKMFGKVEVAEVYLGICDNKAKENIKNITFLKSFDFGEWVEFRDLFGIDGRNIGMYKGIRLFIPYWENLTEWASIPKEREKEVAGLCKYYNRRLLDLLKEERYDTRKIGKMVKLG